MQNYLNPYFKIVQTVMVFKSLTHFSNLNKSEKNKINKITVDFDIVYKVTVIYCKDQLDKPISRADAIAIGIILRK